MIPRCLLAKIKQLSISSLSSLYLVLRNAWSLQFNAALNAQPDVLDLDPYSHIYVCSCFNVLKTRPLVLQVLIIGATNQKASLDDALLRPGRFDRAIHMGLPGEEQRFKILQVLCCI